MTKNEYKQIEEILTPLEGISINIGILKDRYRQVSNKMDAKTKAEITSNFKRIEKTISTTIDGIVKVLSGAKNDDSEKYASKLAIRTAFGSMIHVLNPLIRSIENTRDEIQKLYEEETGRPYNGLKRGSK